MDKASHCPFVVESSYLWKLYIKNECLSLLADFLYLFLMCELIMKLILLITFDFGEKKRKKEVFFLFPFQF